MRASARSLALVLVLTGTVSLAGVSTRDVSTAAASPLDDARSRAAAVTAQVHRLQDHSEAAGERYAAANAELASSVSRYQEGARLLDAARSDLDRQRLRARTRVRALWEGGGTLGMLSGAFQAGDLASLSSRLAAVQHVAQDDRDRLLTAGRAAARARELAASLDGLALRQTALRGQAREALVSAQVDLDAARTLLTRAGADVTRLVEQQQRDEAARSAAGFRARLAAAIQAARIQAARDAAAAARAASLGSAAAGATGTARAGGAAGGLALPLGGTVPPSEVAVKVIAAARTLLGQPYVWGGTGPQGFDCSGLTGWAYASAGISLPRTAAQQWLSGPHPPIEQMQPGDLLFWASDPTDMSTIHHVALYLGGGMMISTDHPGDVARVQPIWDAEFVGATRPDPLLAVAVPGPRWAPGT